MISPKYNFVFVPLMILALAACQGKSPFDRSNEPTKDYSDLKQDSKEFKDLRVEKVDNGQSTCGKIYDLEVKDTAARNLIFVEGEEKSYIINLRSYIAPNYQFVIASGPDKSITLKKADNQGNWKISWRPPQNTADRRTGSTQKILSFAFKPDFGSVNEQRARNCLIESFVEDFTLTVNLNRVQPTISLEGLKDQQVKSSQEKISFDVFVTDPSSTFEDTPTLGWSKPDISTSEVKTVTLRPLCTRAQETKNSITWRFGCDIDLSSVHAYTNEKMNGEMLYGQINVEGRTSAGRTSEIKKTIKIIVDRPPTELEKVDPNQNPTTGVPPIPTFRPTEPLAENGDQP